MALIMQRQPNDLYSKRPHAAFLEDDVSLFPSEPATMQSRPESVDSSVTRWVEATFEMEICRKRYCHSDTLLTHSHGELISRRMTNSVPNMGSKIDKEGFLSPLEPLSIPSGSDRASSSGPSVMPSASSSATTGSSKKTLVERPDYRLENLKANNIYFRFRSENFPNEIVRLLDCLSKDRDLPGLSLEDIWIDAALEDLSRGAAESAVEDYFKSTIFPNGRRTVLQRTDKIPAYKNAVPQVHSSLRISTPVPDMLCGYNRGYAFSRQEDQLQSMQGEMTVNSHNLLYPFFAIEFKADSPSSSGSLVVATNQCLGDSATCVNLAERLNQRLRECQKTKNQKINCAAFSIAMSGSEARFYVSWKDDESHYYMQKFDHLCLQDPQHHLKFRSWVLNIMDWGTGTRLKEIQNALDALS